MKKKFSRSLILNKKSVAKLDSNVKSVIVGGNYTVDNTCEETCEFNCIPYTAEPSCAGTCWYSECHCGGDDRYTGDAGWGDCS